ncbi:MAG: phenylalanine--tRNA ligase subunit beta [Alphaproteobacteria bacterium]|nr:phenylalanine--tRNA ligase subunit beta [Alphaproteobacteria bacterium]
MKFPLSLLKRFLITEASLETIGATLTAIGLEVDGIEDPSAALKPFVVAEIIHAEKHPQADKLQVCRVKAARGELQIVCGAPNARAGIKVALANIGSIIPTNGMEIKAAKVRGIESQGMMCSARELGLGEDHAGIIELPLDAAIGTSIVEVLGLGDPVLDINVTANRGDCMGVYGIARDLAAAGLGSLKPLCVPEINASGTCPISITITDTDGCSAFIGRVITGVRNGASPEWLQRTLTAAGMRPISALVDITNYFSLAFGRPLHVYDMAKLRGAITVRRADEDESFAALNDKTYTLSPRDCVIADEAGVIGIGGIMGGSRTGVSDTTTDVLLEVALFNPGRIAATGRALQIDSDARSRFERGVDRGFAEIADARATDLILELCRGVASERALVGELKYKMPEIAFDTAAINALGGVDVPESRQREILASLGFRDHGVHVHAPSWRHDVSQPADLAEEILRIIGYDAIPLASLPKPAHISRPALDSAQARVSRMRRTLATRGLHETYSWGFYAPAQAALFGGQSEALHLLNPISAELSVMRGNLLPHLLDAVRSNAARGLMDAALFEVGATFVDTTPTGQRTVAAGVRAGLRHGNHWAGSPPADLFDVKADVLAALDAAGFDAAKAQISRRAPAWYHPGRSGALTLGPKTTLASFGELHPATLAALGVDFPVLAFELHLDALPAAKPGKRKALASSDFQAVRRDFAFVVEDSLAAADLLKAVNGAEKTLLRAATIFDVYAGKGVASGKKSIALTVTLQADDRTLTDVEIEGVAKAIITSAMKVGAVLR